MLVGFSIVTLVGAGAVGLRWKGGQRGPLQPGATTHGHHQIELSCESCHTPFGGVTQEACVRCHAEELERADDSHPATKFMDPRNADRLEHLNALLCVTCHVEHQPARTLAMGLTQPADVCFHCHSDIGTERASHQGLAFDSCASAGCHNFHDNLALNVDFMQAHLDEPNQRRGGHLPSRAQPRHDRAALTSRDADAPAEKLAVGTHTRDWAESAHATAGINCCDCHGLGSAWVERPAHTVCATCHADEVRGFLSGLHGMRLTEGLSPRLAPMTPGEARLPMRPQAAHEQLGCQSCHGAHAYDLRRAAVESCLGCHADEHSRAYRGSPHFALLQAEREQRGPEGSGVSCATCHLPRLADGRVQHNQNDNLRPNEKMIRGVCLECHGLGFSLDALADRALVRSNYHGLPTRHIRSLDMVRQQLSEKQKQRAHADN